MKEFISSSENETIGKPVTMKLKVLTAIYGMDTKHFIITKDFTLEPIGKKLFHPGENQKLKSKILIVTFLVFSTAKRCS